MSIVKFIISKTFLKQLAIAIAAIVVIIFVTLFWLRSTTNHGSFETVPELKGKTVSVAKIELEDNNLVMQIQDSSNYNPKYPKGSVIEQDPLAGEQVKENRKIYLTLNPSGYRKVLVPNLKNQTFRQAKPKIIGSGFKIGKITYLDNVAKDYVLDVKFEGKSIKSGTLLSKTSKIDLVLGNGKRPQ